MGSASVVTMSSAASSRWWRTARQILGGCCSPSRTPPSTAGSRSWRPITRRSWTVRNFKSLKQELQKDIDISERLSSTGKKLQAMVHNANKVAEEAKAAADKIAVNVGEGSAVRVGTGWVPRTLELKGYCTYGDRYNKGVSAEFASDCMEMLRKEMDDDEANNVNWERALAAGR